MLSCTTWGAGGSIAAVSSCAAIFVAAKVVALDASTLSADGFGTLFFGGMISSSDNHGGRQCCSRPKPSNTRSPQGLTRTQNTERTKDERNERTDFTNLVSLPLHSPIGGYLYTLVGFSLDKNALPTTTKMPRLAPKAGREPRTRFRLPSIESLRLSRAPEPRAVAADVLGLGRIPWPKGTRERTRWV